MPTTATSKRKAACPACGRIFTVHATGRLAQHSLPNGARQPVSTAEEAAGIVGARWCDGSGVTLSTAEAAPTGLPVFDGLVRRFLA